MIMKNTPMNFNNRILLIAEELLALTFAFTMLALL